MSFNKFNFSLYSDVSVASSSFLSSHPCHSTNSISRCIPTSPLQARLFCLLIHVIQQIQFLAVFRRLRCKLVFFVFFQKFGELMICTRHAFESIFDLLAEFGGGGQSCSVIFRTLL